jgi:hypothetical protein
MITIKRTDSKKQKWWTRNPFWLPLPDVNVGDNRFVGLYAVFEKGENLLNIGTIGGVGNTIDFGDGTTSTLVGTIEHVYDYSTIVSPILSMGQNNYKMVVVDFDLTGVSQLFLDNLTSTRGIVSTQWLDIILGGSSLSRFTPSGINTSYPLFLERLKVVEGVTAGSNSRMLHLAYSIKVVDVTYWDTSQLQFMIRSSGDFRDSNGLPISINNSVDTNLDNPFSNSSVTELGNLSFLSATNQQSMFNGSKLMKVGNLNFPILTTLQGAFANSYIRECGIITVSTNLTTIQNIFSNCYGLTGVEFSGDMSGVTTVVNAFNNCYSLAKLITPGLTRGLDLRTTQLTGTPLQEFFTSLGTASGSQTITLPTFTIGEDTTIATDKDYIIAYA